MRNLAICGAAIPHLQPWNTSLTAIDVDGVRTTCGVVGTPVPTFDVTDPAFARMVRIRVRAFSCNYRDKALILQMATAGRADGFYVIGSEFAGEVVDTGSEVTRVVIGDRVIADNCWPDRKPVGWSPGIPTNHASKEYLVLREEKVARIPASMPDDVAAAFAIGAQTTYSMIRKLDASSGSCVLVTAARSNTSLFAIAALRAHGATVYATTTSSSSADALRALGVERVFCVDPRADTFLDHAELKATALELGGFDGVLDPFFDLHLAKSLPVVRNGGRYTTCGFYDQYLRITGGEFPASSPNYTAALQVAMVGNIHIIGNCVGTSEDLDRALHDYNAGRLHVTVDSVYGGEDAGAFIDRTYNARDRFGKVIFQYT